MDKEVIVQEVLKSINNLKPKHNWDIMVRNAYDSLALAKLDISIQELHRILKTSTYTFDKERQLYIKGE